MFQGTSETQELRNLYNFGELGSAVNRRPNGSPAQAPPPVSNGDNNNRQENSDNYAADYSPREEPNNGDVPVSPAAFGNEGGGYTAAAAASGGAGAAAAVGNTDKHSKTGVLKEVLGTNKKSTKGMTDEQKNAVRLEERWKSALLEEQRLNALEQRVNQEEAVTAEVGQLPNFPRKFLCLRPLVYHSISEVPEHRRLFVTMVFWDWVALCILLVMNCGIAIGIVYAPVRSNVVVSKDVNKALNDVLAAIYLVGIPLSFLIWYWRVYRACSTGRPPQHVLALCGLLIALAQAIFALVGPINYGVCGIMLAMWIERTRETGVVAPVAIMAVLWAAQAVFLCFVIVKEFIYYRKDLAARRAARRHNPNVVG
ncbi:SCAMP family [Novymonas esmeraldas]|uniref:SCAMP family n=1 Tax=Novymonas esmeraldas TaxID=1808958 RepID=A0AAW0F2H1_9TRYP